MILPIPSFLACLHPLAQIGLLVLGLALLLQALLYCKFQPGVLKWSIPGTAALLLLILWLGAYPFSPLGFGTGRIPVFRGFSVTTRAKPGQKLAPAEFLTLVSGSPATIEPILLLKEVSCTWSSTNGGQIDDPQTCGIDYKPPPADYDILKLHLQPACGLPASSVQLKISLLPP